MTAVNLTTVTARLEQAQELINDRLLPLLRLLRDDADSVARSVADDTGSERLGEQTLSHVFAVLTGPTLHADRLATECAAAADRIRQIRRKVADLTPAKR